MRKRKQIIISRILEFGGNNTYLKTLIKYFGSENVIIVLLYEHDIAHIAKIDPAREVSVKLLQGIHGYPRFKKSAFFYNIKEALRILKSAFLVFRLAATYNFADISISVIEPEKYLYFFWLPLIKVKYILHTKPGAVIGHFTTTTCNTRLGDRKEIITVSSSNKAAIVKNWNISHQKAKRVHVVYNCLVKKEKAKGHLSHNNNNTPLILTMGHVEEYKNPVFWLEVALRVISKTDAVFCWLGNGFLDETLFEELREKTKNIDRINFIGFVDNPEFYLRKAAVYYQPSLSETHGIAVVEAMAHHLPCIVSNVGGLPESVEHNKNGFLVDPENVDENVGRITELLSDSSLCKSFGEYSFKRYKDFFSYGVFKKKMDKIYHE